MSTSELVRRLQVARQSLQLPQALAKLDRHALLILDDLWCVRKDQAETSVSTGTRARPKKPRGQVAVHCV